MELPADLASLAAYVADSPVVRVGDFGPFGPPPELSLSGLNRVLELYAQDQVVVVQAGIEVAALQAELGQVGLTLPYAPDWAPASVGDAIALNLPHLLQGRFGSWRDWVLGATFVTAEGEIAKSGSRAVKSVAGYDLHRWSVGARHTLLIYAEVILRVYPSAMVSEVASTPLSRSPEEGDSEFGIWWQRAKEIFDPTNKLNPEIGHGVA